MSRLYLPTGKTPDESEIQTWNAEIYFDKYPGTERIVETAEAGVRDLNIASAIVGFCSEDPDSDSGRLELVTWRDARPEIVPNPDDAGNAAAAEYMLRTLGGAGLSENTIPSDELRVIMGRNRAGYRAGVVADIEELQSGLWTVDHELEDGHMFSMRKQRDGGLEDHHEPAGRIKTERTPAAIEAIERLGDSLEQSHIAIENMRPGVTVTLEWHNVDQNS